MLIIFIEYFKINMITIEIDWNTDIIEVLKNDLPLSIKNKIIKKK